MGKVILLFVALGVVLIFAASFGFNDVQANSQNNQRNSFTYSQNSQLQNPQDIQLILGLAGLVGIVIGVAKIS